MDERYVEEVLRVVELIPAGCVATYGDIAQVVGRGGPRQVGLVMSRYGGSVSWWRVVRADGRLAAGHQDRASVHLAAENTTVRDGRVRLSEARFDFDGAHQ